MRYRLTFLAGVAVGYVLGARAGRERYEQLRKAAREVAQNPAVRNTAEAAAHGSREIVSKMSSKLGTRLPDSVTDRVRSLRSQRGGEEEDEWGTSNT